VQFFNILVSFNQKIRIVCLVAFCCFSLSCQHSHWPLGRLRGTWRRDAPWNAVYCAFTNYDVDCSSITENILV